MHDSVCGIGGGERVLAQIKSFYRNLLCALPATASLRLQFIRNLGYNPNFTDPKTFNEKVNALKLDPASAKRFAPWADKVKVKGLVSDIIGEQYVIPTLWAGKKLPSHPSMWPVPFVLKANHASGWNYFVRQTDASAWCNMQQHAKYWLTTDWLPYLHETWYNAIDRMILVEPVIGGTDLKDYKFFVFNGKVKYIQVDTERFTNHRRSFYDKYWSLQPFGLKYPRHSEELPCPKHLNLMSRLAEQLGSRFTFVRVDFYDLDNGPLFGEMTFAPEAGFGRFYPSEWDRIVGTEW